MNEHEWNATTDAATVAHRAGGRRHYNSARQRQAFLRRMKVVKLIAELGFLDGAQSEIARRLGVHRSTICRDFEYFDLLERGFSPYEIHLRRKADKKFRNGRTPHRTSNDTTQFQY